MTQNIYRQIAAQSIFQRFINMLAPTNSIHDYICDCVSANITFTSPRSAPNFVTSYSVQLQHMAKTETVFHIQTNPLLNTAQGILGWAMRHSIPPRCTNRDAHCFWNWTRSDFSPNNGWMGGRERDICKMAISYFWGEFGERAREQLAKVSFRRIRG